MGNPLDFLAKEVHLGDSVVYPTRSGSDMHMRKGTVVNIQATATSHTLKIKTETWEGQNRVVYVPIGRAVVVPR